MKKFAATLLLAAKVAPSGRFAWRQLRGDASGPREYRIRATGRIALIRHDSDDPHVLAECFGRLRAYEPPEAVAAALEQGPPKRVLDFGANIGLFGLLALGRYPGCTVTGIEADPANAELHRRVIEANGLGERWNLVEALAATATGTARFAAGQSSRSRQAGPGEEAVEVPAIDAFEELAGADLVKIDIEGGEWALLADPRFRDLDAETVVIECHANGCPVDDPRAAAIEALEGAGYQTIVTDAPGARAADPFEGQGTVWAWRA